MFFRPPLPSPLPGAIDALLIITLFLLTSVLACLLTLRLSINIKHLCLFFHSLPILTDILKFVRFRLFFMIMLAIRLVQDVDPLKKSCYFLQQQKIITLPNLTQKGRLR